MLAGLKLLLPQLNNNSILINGCFQDGNESVASTIMTEEDIEEHKDTISVETDEGDEATEVHNDARTSDMSGAPDEYINPRGVRFTPQEPAKEGMELNIHLQPRSISTLDV